MAAIDDKSLVTKPVAALAAALLACGSCAGDYKRWTSVWSGSFTTLWLDKDGQFESEEEPVASTKPSPCIFMKGTWTASSGTLTLNVGERAYLEGPPPSFRSGSIEKVAETITLNLSSDGATITCPHLHLTPQLGIPDSPFDLKKANPSPPLPDWDSIEERLKTIASARPQITKSALAANADPLGKTSKP